MSYNLYANVKVVFYVRKPISPNSRLTIQLDLPCTSAYRSNYVYVYLCITVILTTCVSIAMYHRSYCLSAYIYTNWAIYLYIYIYIHVYINLQILTVDQTLNEF